MKIFLPVVLLTVIAILSCSLRYEVVRKNRIGAETAKSWQQYAITQGLQNYKDLQDGDVDLVKRNLMAATIVYAKYYEGKFGKVTGTPFSDTLSESLALKNIDRGNRWANSLTNMVK